MIYNILSMLDPGHSTIYQAYPKTFWVILTFFLLLLTAFWVKPTQMDINWGKFLLFANNQTKRTQAHRLKAFNNIISAMLIMHLSLNLFSLLPYTFNMPSHPLYTTTFAFPLCLAIIASCFTTNVTTFFAGLIPAGSPNWLASFLIFADFMSIASRPISLFMRMSVTMTTGHVMAAMLSTPLASAFLLNKPLTFLLLFALLIVYTLFKIMVCFLQSLLFFGLLAIYTDDHPNT